MDRVRNEKRPNFLNPVIEKVAHHGAVALLASYIPARRAARVDPNRRLARELTT